MTYLKDVVVILLAAWLGVLGYRRFVAYETSVALGRYQYSKHGMTYTRVDKLTGQPEVWHKARWQPL